MKTKKKANKANKKPSRKQLRKEQRIEKKIKKNNYYTKRVKANFSASSSVPGQYVRNPNFKKNGSSKDNTPSKEKGEKISTNNHQLSIELYRKKEKEEQKRLQREMIKQRSKQLLLANAEEDRNIKILEKQLKLNKRKTKGIPKSFTEDGLDYLLEVCDPDKMKVAINAEEQFANFNDDFIEDLALMSNKTVESKKQPDKFPHNNELSDNSNISDNDEELDTMIYDEEDYMNELSDNEDNDSTADSDSNTNEENKNYDITEPNESENEIDIDLQNISTNGQDYSDLQQSSGNESPTNYDSEEEFDSQVSIKGATKINSDGTWEDIYGRLRAKDGSLITSISERYIPPAVRAKLSNESSNDRNMIEKLNILRKQIKGLLNRLAESNMHSIVTQLENMYMNNSRNNMNETLTNLILESIVSNVLTPERLLLEHVLLMTILHANIGTEIGAHFLQSIISTFDKLLKRETSIEDKSLDNIVIILAQLYNFKLFAAKLLYEILHALAKEFNEKNIDCILHVLRNVGFSLRKDDPLALKDLILELQKKAATVSKNVVNGSRIKYLLDILLAIKNNNVMKIPNYDTSYSEHLKKIMKSFLRKGNYVSQLNINLQDLLKAEEKGKWWLVGSAWTGNVSQAQNKLPNPAQTSFSQKLLDLAKKQRMNTDTRRNIFCIIMSAEDYFDAFEKLLHLGLSNNQDREIIHVILHCCLHESPYNPYYSFLAQKFCDYDRKYQLTIKYTIWDKLKTLDQQSNNQLSNLAKLLTHLFLEKGLPISTLKVVQFSELDKVTLRFIRQILLGILLHDDIELCTQVFENVAQSVKLKMFRESLRLFIHHFLLKNIDPEMMDNKQCQVLVNRSKIIEKLLVMKGGSKF